MSKLTKTNEQGLEEFNKLKASIDDQIKNLLAIKVTDETSMVVANQQLSKGKQLTKAVEEAHKIVKEPALKFCQAADKAKREMINPLDSAMQSTERKVIEYSKKIEKEKQEELLRLSLEKASAEKEALENQLKLVSQMKEFEARAFKLINDANTPAELSFVYTNYVVAFPPSYDVNIVERIKKLGKAKLTSIQNESIGNLQAYQTLYAEYTGTKQEIVAPIVMPTFDAIEKKIAIVETATPPSNIKKEWKFEVVNMEDVPLNWLVVDEAKVKAYIKENSSNFTDGIIESGIKFYQEMKLKVK